MKPRIRPNVQKKRGYLSPQPRFYPAVAFAAYTGARRGEVLTLRWGDIHFEASPSPSQGPLPIERSSSRRRTTAVELFPCQRRSAQFCGNTMRRAEEGLAIGPDYNDGDLVFAHADGSPVDPWSFGRAVLDCIKRARSNAYYAARLTGHSRKPCTQARVPIEMVSQRFGHASIGITVERYLHVYKDRDAGAVAAFERLVG